MIVVHGSEPLPLGATGTALAIGNFDGVHRGHRALLEAARKQARELAQLSAVMVFEPHPHEFFQPQQPHFPLTPLPRKLQLIAETGIDIAFVQAFDADFARLSAEEFIQHILVQRLAVSYAVVGYDFFFGHKRGGSPQTLWEAGPAYGFGVVIVQPVADDGEVFSSTAIRLLLAQGDVKDAARMLGANWQVHGRVVGGAKRGTGLGYPTANVPMPKGTALGHGIYAVRVHHDGVSHDGAAYLGTRPTFDDGKPVLEVFLFDFDGDLYGHEIAVEFIDFLRADRKFNDAGELIAQMDQDVAKARGVLSEQ